MTIDRMWTGVGAAALAVLAGSGPAAAAPPELTQSCPIANGVAACPQIDPAKGKLVAIDVAWSMSSVFALTIVGDHYGKADYTVTVWNELDTKGGDMGSFYVTKSGSADVAPKDIGNPSPNEITVAGSHQETITDPAVLARFVGTSAVPISPLAEPATGVGKLPTVSAGTITDFHRLSSTAGGTVTLRYQPILIKPPVVKLPKQTLPKPPFTVPPYPKPKKK